MKFPMKKTIGNVFLCVLFISSYGVLAQTEQNETEKKQREVTKYTVMERFEPQLMLTAEERIKLKEERVAVIKKRREILDTLDISERRREKLMNDLLKEPFSPRLSRTLAEIEFEDDNE